MRNEDLPTREGELPKTILLKSLFLDDNLTIQHFEQGLSHKRRVIHACGINILFVKRTFEILFGAQNGKNIESI